MTRPLSPLASALLANLLVLGCGDDDVAADGSAGDSGSGDTSATMTSTTESTVSATQDSATAASNSASNSASADSSGTTTEDTITDATVSATETDATETDATDTDTMGTSTDGTTVTDSDDSTGGLEGDIVQIVAGFAHTCVRTEGGGVRCWGAAGYGQLGYGDTETIGDDETAAAAGFLDLGGPAIDIAAGDDHTCALLQGGDVRCWGRGQFGRLGYGNENDIGDDETPGSLAAFVDVGGDADQIALGSWHTCARLEDGAVRCWGAGQYGRLGYGNVTSIGDTESPASVGPVALGDVGVTSLGLGDDHTCASVSGGGAMCWGLGGTGQLGHNDTLDIGDDELPTAAVLVDVDATLVQIEAGHAHTCARTDENGVRCWGSSSSGQLGYGNNVNTGDDADELPMLAPDVDVGGDVSEIAVGYVHSCALLSKGTVRCWGQGNVGQLGYGNVFPVGDDQVPAEVGDVDLGDGTVTQIAAGYAHTCALIDGGAVRCWGFNGSGQLGYGNLETIGDDELPASVGDVPL